MKGVYTVTPWNASRWITSECCVVTALHLFAFEEKKKARRIRRALEEGPGNVLLSHAVAHAVPSALKGLTTVFGMGTGVAPSLWSPGN